MIRNQLWWCLTVLFLSGVSVMAQRNISKEMIEGKPMYTVLEKGAIPAIYKPTFIDASMAEKYYYDGEPLLVVSGIEDIRAYSTWHLDHHEIVNDRLDGTAVAVTW